MFRNKTLQLKFVKERPDYTQPFAEKKTVIALSDIKDAAKTVALLAIAGYVAKAAVDTTQEITVMAANKKFNQ